MRRLLVSTAIGPPISRGRAPKSTNPVRFAHCELVAAPARNIPQRISGNVPNRRREHRRDGGEDHSETWPVGVIGRGAVIGGDQNLRAP
jgi:hypothetical protein